MKPKVIKLEKTCDVCPAQWYARTSDGSNLYIRFRWGHLTAQVVCDKFPFCGCDVHELIYTGVHGDEFSGTMDDETMIEILSGVIDFKQ